MILTWVLVIFQSLACELTLRRCLPQTTYVLQSVTTLHITATLVAVIILLVLSMLLADGNATHAADALLKKAVDAAAGLISHLHCEA